MANNLSNDLKTLYFDDYDPAKKYYRILFKPGRAVQARELTQIQTALQAQIERIGNYLFSSGDNVFPGSVDAVRYTSNVGFIKLPVNDAQNTASNTQLETHWLNKIIKAENGITAKVIGYRGPDSINGGEVRLFVNYLSASDNGEKVEFASGDVVSTTQTTNETTGELEGGIFTLTIPNDTQYAKVGFVSSVTLDKPYSIYYYKGFFLYVEPQTLFLTPATTKENPNPDALEYQNAWNNKPTALIGLNIIETAVTAQTDPTLYDNATGTSNYSAPGADRLYIDAQLTQQQIRDPNDIQEIADFISLVSINRGEVRYLINYTSKFSSTLEKTLARRTYDESGDYVVSPFIVHIKEFLLDKDEDVDGAHDPSEFGCPTIQEAEKIASERFFFEKENENDVIAFQHTDGLYYPGRSYQGTLTSEKPSFKDLCEGFISVKIDPGKAYVKGFEIQKIGREIVDIPKSRTKAYFNNQIISTPVGSYFSVTDLSGCPDFSQLMPVDLYNARNTTSGARPTAATGAEKIGTARIIFVDNPGVDEYRVYVSDISLNTGKALFDVKSIFAPAGTSGTSITANIKMTETELDGIVSRVNTTTNSVDSDKTRLFGIGTTWKNSAKLALKKGDYIRIGSDPTLYRVSSNPGADNTLTLDVAVIGEPPSSKSFSGTINISATNKRLITAITGVSGTDLYINQKISGTGIPADTRIVSVTVSGTSISLEIDKDSTLTTTTTGVALTVDGTESITRRVSDVYSPSQKIPMWADGSKIYVCYSGLYSDGQDGFLYELPRSFVSNIRTSNSDGKPGTTTDMTYTIPHVVSGNNTTGITIPANGIFEYALPASASGFGLIAGGTYKIVCSAGSSAGTWFKVNQGTTTPTTKGVVNVQLYNNLDGVQTAKFLFNVDDVDNNEFTIVVPLVKNGDKAFERKKFLRKGSFNESGRYVNSGGANRGFFVVEQSAHGVIVLPDQDVVNISRIIVSPNPNDEPTDYKTGHENYPAGHENIVGLYIFDNGQRDHYYGPAVLTFNTAYSAKRPQGKVRVEYDYYDHELAEQGDYFSVDSYVDTEYGKIPTYTSKATGTSYSLTDCIDFRKKLSETTSGAVPIGSATLDFFCYEGRKDKICLDSTPPRDFVLMTGTPSLFPDEADDLPTGMTICEIQHAPYGWTSKACILKMEDNLRYTMKDISKLEKRIKNLEYYTALSLLESHTSNLTITDARGNNRFKNGFLVDNFESHASSDMSTADYRCSLDENLGEAQPFTTLDNIAISESILYPITETPEAKQTRRKLEGHYTRVGTNEKGYTFTLPIKEKTIFMSQQIASQISNVNPYSSFTYVGALTVNPWTDEWLDQKIIDNPPIIDDKAYQTALKTKDGTLSRSKPVVVSEKVTKGEKIRLNDKSGPRSNGELVAVGHMHMERLWKSDRKQHDKVKRTGIFIVPEPYHNAGARLPYPSPMDKPDGQSGAYGVRNVYKQTDKITQKTIATEIKYSVQKGHDELTSRNLVETRLTNIEFMRAREIEYTGECFLGGIKLFAYFDGIPVSDRCRPVIDGDAGWYTISVIPSKTKKNVLEINPAGTNVTFPGDATTGIRKGCEVVIYNTAVTPPQITNKFDILSIGSGRTEITVQEKTIVGMPSPDSWANFPTIQKSFQGKITPVAGDEDSLVTITNISGITTTDLFVNQRITGTTIPANTRIKQIITNASGTAITSIIIDTKSSASSAQTITFSVGVPKPFDVKISKYTFGDPILADNFGNLKGVFKIPNEDGRQIKCGDVLFTLSTASTFENMKSATSKANTRYTARGYLNTQVFQSNYTRKFDIVETKRDIEDDITRFEDRTSFGKISWYDPIAQTFLIEEDGGCFITDVDIFFHSKPIPEKTGGMVPPIRLELRATSDTTVPTSQIIGGETLGRVVIQANDVITNVPYGKIVNDRLVSEGIIVTGSVGGKLDDSNKYYWKGGTDVAATALQSDRQRTGANTSKIISGEKFATDRPSLDMVPTRFTFPTPLYLEQGKVYAVVLVSDSDLYEVWVGQRGKQEVVDKNTEDYKYQKLNTPNFEVGTDINLDGQELFKNGDFYKSKNANGWLIDPKITFKFALHKAQFDLTKEGTINFVNDAVPVRRVFRDGMEVFASKFANGTPDTETASKIRIVSPNHGFVVGDRIVLNMDDSLSDGATELRGFRLKYLEHENGHLVISTEQDTFVIQIRDNEGPTNPDGSRGTHQTDGCYAKTSGRIGGSNTVSQINMRFTECVLSAVTAALPGKTSVDWSIQTTTTKGVNDPRNVSVNTKTLPQAVTPGKRLSFDSPMRINSPINEPSGTTKLEDKKSVVVKAVLKSSNPNLTPQLSYEQLSLSLMSSRLNNPSGIPDGVTGKQNINVPGFDDLIVLDQTSEIDAGDVVFTSSSGRLSGTFTQDDQSRNVFRIGSGLPNLSDEIAPGDTVTDKDSGDSRVVEEVFSEYFTINEPFNPGFPDTPIILSVSPPYMKIKTRNAAIADRMSQMDVGKYASLAPYKKGNNNELIKLPPNTQDETRWSVGFGSEFVSSYDDKLIIDVTYTPNAEDGDPELDGEPCLCSVTVAHYNNKPTVSTLENIRLVQRDRFIDETAPSGGSAAAKYVCKPLQLDNKCEALKITFDGIRDANSTFDLYYKIKPANSQESLSDINWKKATFNIEQDGSLVDATPPAEDGVPKTYECTINGLPPFDMCQAKIVMLGGNPARPPKIKNFTLIALAD